MLYDSIVYTQSPSQHFRLLGPRPWKILATTYEKKRFLSNPDPGENLVSGNIVMETGCNTNVAISITIIIVTALVLLITVITVITITDTITINITMCERSYYTITTILLRY